jgi:NAD-dependent DNA ligase
MEIIPIKKNKKNKPELIILEDANEIIAITPTKNTTLKSRDSKFKISNNKRCKKGTIKYKPIGDGCYTKDEIENYKQLKKNGKTKRVKTIPKITITPEKKENNKIETKKISKKDNNHNKKKVTKRNLKIPVELEIMDTNTVKKRYNEEFIEILDNLNNIMLKHGEPFRARAYQKAQETIMTYNGDISSTTQLKGLPGIGSTIMDKLNEYVETGTLRILEREKNNPINILGDIYGIGPKKAQELIDAGIKTIDELKSKQDELLNEKQKVGLKYYEDILKKIPREEIEEYNSIFSSTFDIVKNHDSQSHFEIVGSYRRGAKSSGDIDVIITSTNTKVFIHFINELISQNIIVEVLSRGPTKCLVIAKLPNSEIYRRIDFLYTPPNEYAFAILYFTGSKLFNTVMRQYALNKGYTFNEHGIYKMENKKKGQKIEQLFRSEKDIFDFLGLQFKTPIERTDGRAVIPYTDVGENNVKNDNDITHEIIPVKKNKTIKIKTPKKTVTEVVVDIDNKKKNSEDNVDDTNETVTIIENFKHNGIAILHTLNENQLTKIIHVANTKYYNQEPIMTDNQFDIVKDFIQEKYPNNLAITEIGAEVERNKVKLPYTMASMDKIKPDTGALSNWMSKNNGPYVLSCKLDGVSGLYTTEGTVPKLYTRGNGKIGQDISHFIPFLKLPKTKGIVIRGEFIIPKQVFIEKYKSTFANPRNMVAGIINHKTISDSVADLHFVAYEVIVPQKIPSEQMEFLTSVNVERVLYQVSPMLSNEMLSNLLIEWRKTYLYEIDGIIVTDDKIYPRSSGNPEHAFAFKMVLSDQVAEAKVVDVIWTPSKDGYLKPRVQIEPIHLGGVTIEYATGFNGSFIKDNKIGIGSTIEIIRSGDVIPHIRSVTVPSEEPKMPSVPYKWNDTHVDIMLENAMEDPTVKEKNITGFFRGIGVEGLSSGNIHRLIDAGFNTVPKILNMSEADFLKAEGMKSKMANKLYTGILEKVKESTIITLMSASNIFGRGFSDKKMELIISEVPDILISSMSNNDKIKKIASVKGMAVKTAEAFVLKIGDFVAFLKECNLENKLFESPILTSQINENIDKSNPLFGKTVVLTGTRDKAIIEYLKHVGSIQGTSVSKSTFLVIAKNKEDDTGKAEEARKLHIPIISVQDFFEQYINKK